MDDDDFRALIEVLARELRAVGAGDIADERHYLQPETEDGEARLYDPQRRLVEMLKAFERKLAVEDRATYDTALSRLNDTIRGEALRGAEVELGLDEDREARFIDLALAPDLSEARQMNSDLVGQLIESGLRPRSPT